MRINYNATAMRANNSLNVADNRVSASLQRLSSGLKLNQAKDNPSGYAIARRMDTQIEGVSVATKNASTGISIIETADGALTEVHEMLQRMNELAIKSATGTLTTSDRAIVQEEMKQLKEEVTRISKDTEFNGQTLLDGSFELKGYTDNLDVKVGYYSDEVIAKVYTIDALDIYYEDIATGKIDLDRTRNSFVADPASFPTGAVLSSVGENCVTITANNGFEITLDIAASTVSPYSLGRIEVDITGIGAMDTQIGANEGQTLAIRIPTISLQRLGLTNADLSTQESSSDAIEAIKGAVAYVSSARSRLGAYQNRLEHTVSSLDITNENMTASYSRIMDADVSEEMTDYTTQQVVEQAAVSMLAQANERPSQILQLLQ